MYIRIYYVTVYKIHTIYLYYINNIRKVRMLPYHVNDILASTSTDLTYLDIILLLCKLNIC